VLATAAGWQRTGRPGVGWFVLLLAVAVISPALLLNHVSELYVYSALPPLCVLAGVGLGAWATRPVARLALGLLFLLHLSATEAKIAAMRANGRQATHLLGHLVPRAQRLPPGGVLTLVQPPVLRHRYSVFWLEGWDVLAHGVTGVVTLSGRSDIGVHIVEAGQPAVGEAVTLRDGRVVELARN
ncbi:MAG: hypothetical protein HUU35_19395, partial [Armatimonadetes bacterium]|nr:hypothetical protein [Armatimonadota bacterium]